MKNRFLKYQAQTSPHPLAIEIEKAEGNYIYSKSGKKYLDFIAGVSANTLGHKNKAINKAITDQLDSYSHVMVYGEFVQDKPLELCEFLASKLPSQLSTTYLTNSGTEATEGAIKLAKRYTGRSTMVSCKNSYHGNTQGAMSVCGVEEQNRAFRPLVPGIKFIEFNNEKTLSLIDENTAGVIIETIQGGAGFILPTNGFLKKVSDRCKKVGALLILDEIQSGIGRTGKLFCFENYNMIPDIVITGKGLGGGMPVGAFISSQEIMTCLQTEPKLGHITTFGGHPIIAASCLATLKELYKGDYMQQIDAKEKLFRSKLQHPLIKEIRGRGLMLAIVLETPELINELIMTCMDEGLLLFWLVFEAKAARISPALNISEDEIIKGCDILLKVMDELKQ